MISKFMKDDLNGYAGEVTQIWWASRGQERLYPEPFSTQLECAMNSILVIDSETVVATGLQGTLRQFGFEAELADSGKMAHACLSKAQFDLILVEFDLSPRPSGNAVFETVKSAAGCWSGTGLIRELRAARITSPIVVHTVLEGELYETASLDAGADDYIVKKAPISILLSRLHAHLRRSERDLGLAAKAERRVAVGRFTLDRKARVLLADQKPISLAHREMKLLEKLASSPSRVFSPDEILDEVWGSHLRRSLPALSGLLRRLRQKMAKNDLPDPVENVRGRGFRLLPSISLNAEARVR
jgi:DNA-binding response OmpR family regulator